MEPEDDGLRTTPQSDDLPRRRTNFGRGVARIMANARRISGLPPDVFASLLAAATGLPGITGAIVERWETGTHAPSIAVVLAACEVAGIDIEDLM